MAASVSLEGQVVTYQLAYVAGEVDLCARHVSETRWGTLGAVSHGAHRGDCEACRLDAAESSQWWIQLQGAARAAGLPVGRRSIQVRHDLQIHLALDTALETLHDLGDGAGCSASIDPDEALALIQRSRR